LGRLEHEEFKVLPVVVDGNAPLLVVVFDIKRIISAPGASELVRTICTPAKDYGWSQ
jgi:hypothetical protein